MTQQEIEDFVMSLDGIEREENMGYIFFFLGDNHYVPIVSIGYADNEGDAVSHLNREGIFRVNIGMSKQSFNALFPKFSLQESSDYTVLDVFMPHPHYAQQSYICILNPSQKNKDQVKKYITEAHFIAQKRREKTQ